MTNPVEMKHRIVGPEEGIDPGVYVQLIRHLFGTKASFFASTLGSVLIGYVAWDRSHDTIFLWLFLPLLVTSLLRFGVLIHFERDSRETDDVARARYWEALYAGTTLAWSLVFGVTAFLAMLKDDSVLHIYVTFLLIAFAGGMAGRNASRPLIVYGQVLAVIVPYAAGLALNAHEYYLGLLLLVGLQVVSVKGMTGHIYRMLNTAMTSALRSKTLATQFESALNNMSHGLCMVDAGGGIVVHNDRFLEILSIPADAMAKGESLRSALAHAAPTGDYSETVHFGIMAERLVTVGEGSVPTRIRSGRTVELRAQPMENGGTVFMVEDVTERHAAAGKIERMAHYDDLTGLPNRSLFKAEIEKAFATLRTQGTPFSVLSLDLDQFKEVNDTLGHPMGDKLLVQVGDRLRRETRKSDLLARFGGDEFFILQRPGSSEEETVCLAERIVRAISVPYLIEGHNINVGVSIGIARGGEHGENVDDLLKNTDQALYKSKNDGRSRYCIFRPEMDLEAQARRMMEVDMRKAIDDEAFTVFFQPIVDIATSRVTCFEALARWSRADGSGMVSPADFIPLAEQTGLIVDLGGLIMRMACAEAAKWPTDIRVAVNVSAVQFQHNAVIRQVTEALVMSGLPAHRLEVEITESLAIQNMDRTIEVIETLRKMGVKIALDDFGTGETSLSYLDRIPFDKVKLDRSFVKHLATRQKSLSLIRLMANYLKECGSNMVVEGVETEEELQILRGLGVPEVQGFFFSKPNPAAEIQDMIAKVKRVNPVLRAVA